MKTKLTLLLSALLTLGSAAFATQVTVSGDETIFDLDGTTPVAVGDAVVVGYFDSSVTTQDIADFAEALTTGTIKISDEGALDGFNVVYSQAVTVDNGPGIIGGNQQAEGILGEQLYMWVFNSSDPFNPANNPNLGTLFVTSTNSEWIAKGDSFAPLDRNSLLVSEIDTILIGTDLGGDAGLQLALIPEPSTYAMIAAGLLALAFVIRRRR